jgi:hypothetical protein
VLPPALRYVVCVAGVGVFLPYGGAMGVVRAMGGRRSPVWRLMVATAAGLFVVLVLLPSGPTPRRGSNEHRASADHAATESAPFVVTGALAGFLRPWISHVQGCLSAAQRGGPSLGRGETQRVTCAINGITVHFVSYHSIVDRDYARALVASRNTEAQDLTSGVMRPEYLRTPSGRSTGAYIEYAYRTVVAQSSQIVAGLWWDDAARPLAGYMLADWTVELGGRWDPLRDVWQRLA